MLPALLQRVFFASLVIITFINTSQAEAYKCDVNGSISYSQTPCVANAKQAIMATHQGIPPYSEQKAKEIAAQEKSEANRLAQSRHKTENKNETEMKAIAARNTKKKQQCDEQQLKIKWVKEDLANAKPKAESQARQKVKRATEKAALVCGR
ncbi:hypothetical protein LPB67_05600 [Undibacterium sp. Jales W-56]|uniref:hypothetical protein n=1 Tax=Undibacterium sp. Jales W-56 TaxID=2897325 RepID=UPI0021D24FE1|nr:hypothetical protein [Undibacterium sp. Jales W-56]MCU6433251.1 hypothetical protein [Undibacterium sp. Jales W-56]